ncbi:hypothetical protein N9948_00390 [bacterium]|nr:hypothetical protein [bacterium]
MFEITADYIRSELLKVAFLLESNYQKILTDKRLLSKINGMPVDWDLSKTEINGRDFLTERDFKRTKSQDRDFWEESHVTNDKGNDVIRDFTIYGEIKKDDTKIPIKLTYKRSPRRNLASLYIQKDGEWEHSKGKTTLENIKKYLEKEVGLVSETAELLEIYQNIMADKKQKTDFIDFVKKEVDDRPWKANPKTGTRSYSLRFYVPQLDDEGKQVLIETIKKNNVEEKFKEMFNQKLKEMGIDPKHILLNFSYPPSSVFSFIISHNNKEKHD